MTSKISFFKLARDEWGKLAWVTFLFGVIFGLLIPFITLIIMATDGRYVEMKEVLYDDYWSNMGLGHWWITVCILAAGVFCAFCAFGYLHSPVKLDFYHSLPLRRRTLFAAKLLGSVFTFVIPYVACQALGLLVGLPYGVVGMKGAAEVAVATGLGILYFLVSYASALAALMLTGRMLTTVFAVGVFGCYIPMINVLMILLREAFFPAWLGESHMFTSALIRNSSPWAFCLSQDLSCMKTMADGTAEKVWPSVGSAAVLLLMAAVLLLASLLLYQKRKTERAGSAIAFRWMEGVIKVALVVPACVFAGTLGCGLIGGFLWGAGFILLFGLLGCMIMEFIYRWDIRQVFANKAQTIFALAASLLLFCGLYFDVSGYNTWLPPQEEIASMAVYETYHHFGVFDSQQQPLDYAETEDFAPLYRIAQSGVDMTGRDVEKEILEDGLEISTVSVKYHLKNGKTVYRKYRVPRELFYECIDEMLQDPEYCKNFYPIMRCDPDGIMRVDIEVPLQLAGELRGETPDPAPEDGSSAGEEPETDSAKQGEDLEEETYAEEIGSAETYPFENISITQGGEDLRRFVEAYRKDLLQAPYEEVDEAEGMIYIDYGTYPHGDDFGYYGLSGSFSETVRFLKEYVAREGFEEITG